MREFALQQAIEFAEWISDNGWIKDPFPQKGYDDDLIRYTNISEIDIYSDDKLLCHTIKELYELFIKSKEK